MQRRPISIPPSRINRRQNNEHQNETNTRTKQRNQQPQPMLATQHQIETDRNDSPRQILLDQHQWQRPPHRRPPLPQHQPLQAKGQQRHSKADLMKIEPNRVQQPPRKAIRDTDNQATRRTRHTNSQPRDRHNRHSQQKCLRNEQRRRITMQQIERRQHSQNRTEVVPQQRKPRSLQIRRRPMTISIRTHGLLKDTQIISRALIFPIQHERPSRVTDEEQPSQNPNTTGDRHHESVPRGR